jgi:hypothetical protein
VRDRQLTAWAMARPILCDDCVTSIYIYITSIYRYTQTNGAVSMVNKGKPHHSFVYTLYKST